MRLGWLLIAILISQSAFGQMVGTSEEAPDQDYCQFLKGVKELHVFKREKNMNNLYIELDDPIDNDLKHCTKQAAQELLYVHHLNFKQPFLDELETLMISTYVGHGFTFINLMAKFKNPPAGKKLIEVMDRGLSKLPDHEGIVYSGNSNYQIAQFKPGMIRNFPGYLSTSLKMDVAKSFMGIKGTSGVLFKLHVINGKNLSETFNSFESEVLVPRGSRFKVIAISNDGADRVVEMKQVLN